jgi:hypothetical protein
VNFVFKGQNYDEILIAIGGVMVPRVKREVKSGFWARTQHFFINVSVNTFRLGYKIQLVNAVQ